MMMKNNWIPCSERLPEVDISEKTKNEVGFDSGKDFLVTYDDGSVGISTFWAKGKVFDDAVIAWMPLPEPYGGE